MQALVSRGVGGAVMMMMMKSYCLPRYGPLLTVLTFSDSTIFYKTK